MVDIVQAISNITDNALREAIKKEYAEVAIRQYHAIFEDVPNLSSALEFGAKGISLRALNSPQVQMERASSGSWMPLEP